MTASGLKAPLASGGHLTPGGLVPGRNAGSCLSFKGSGIIPSYRASLLGGVALGDKANCSLGKGDSLSPRGKLPAPAMAP